MILPDREFVYGEISNHSQGEKASLRQHHRLERQKIGVVICLLSRLTFDTIKDFRELP
jgi:hypothetical protein